MKNPSISYSSLVIAVVFVGVLLRLFGVFGGLWLDEIHSLHIAQSVATYSDIWLENFSDNNHPLNTGQMAILIGLFGEVPDFTFRIIPFVFSCLTIWFVYKCFENSLGRSQLIAVSLFSLSYPLVLFTTEARGYSFLVFACVAAFYVHIRRDQLKDAAVLFSAICVFGLLSHYSFLVCAVAIFVRHLILLSEKKSSLVELAAHHTPWLLTSFGLYFLHLRYVTEGTGSLRGHLEVVINTLSVSFGWPELQPHYPLKILLLALIFLVI